MTLSFQLGLWEQIGEMEYIEHASCNTFYPFQNKHQIHRHIQSVKVCAFKNQNLVCHEMS